MDEPEVLTGGNTSVVVRVGDTVRRPVGHWTPAVHALLSHLRDVGFDGAPTVLGIDGDIDGEHEVLRFVPGEVGTLDDDAPLAPWFRTPQACTVIGTWLREMHSAQRDFAPDPGLPWRRSPGRALAAGEVIVHHDVSPYNTVRRADGSLVVLDWDFARPGDPLQDLAWACWRWAPLMAGSHWHTAYGISPGTDVEAHQRANLTALVDAFRPSNEQQARLADIIESEMRSHASDLEEMAAIEPAFASLVERDYARCARVDADWWARSPLRAVVTPDRAGREGPSTGADQPGRVEA